MAAIQFIIIMFIIGYFLKDLAKFLVVGLLVFFVLQNGWNIIPMAFSLLVNFIDIIKGAL